MKLYTYYNSSASYRVRIALNLKGLVPEMVYIDLIKGEQRSADYAAINPQMIVPTLIDKGEVLSQSLAIIEYLDESYPGPALLPKEPFARVQARELALLVAADISPVGNLKLRKYLAGELKQSEAACEEWMRYWMNDGFKALEKILATSPHTGKFCVGDTPSIADCCLMPQLYNARRWKCDLAPYPTVLRIAQACEAHPAFQAAHPDNQADKPRS